MTKKLLTPKYITPEICKKAVQAAFSLTMIEGGALYDYMKRHHGHTIVLVPAITDDRERDYPDYPHYPIEPYLLYEESFGDKSNWEHPYDEVVKCKGLQVWHDRSDGKSITPHLLYPGDTPYPGGVKREGIVVAYSGVQEHFDRMIAAIIADIIISLAKHAMLNDPEATRGDFLP
ncbi:MAG: hypothetical protein CR972_04710 [Candidatus Moraniibacteriota bacterium]|nr:MAG: hypothetical protein CR972_04710 [Candidatus Moranbacteria bacterium]